MVQVSYPGVYVQEVPSGVRTITGVSTSIAAFVGMASNGPMFVPTTVLGFTDYTRIFSASTALGEMTDQVRQFFLNGGQQAVIVRVAKGAGNAAIQLFDSEGGAPVLTLQARAQGLAGNALRASVDYNTAYPERTFNLTVYQELVDAGGNTRIGPAETFSNVSVDESDPRYVKRVVEEESQFVGSVTVNAGSFVESFSASAVFAEGANAATAQAAFAALVQGAMTESTGDTSVLQGKFTVRVGAQAPVVVTLDWQAADIANFDAAEIVAAIDADLTSATATLETRAVAVGRVISYLRITASDANVGDVLVTPGPDHDIAVRLGLGSAQGGIEVGRASARRPVPSGFVSEVSLGATSAVLPALGGGEDNRLDQVIALAESLKSEFEDGFELTGTLAPFTVASTTFPSTGASQRLRTGTAGAEPSDLSFRNVRQNLLALATTINSTSSNGGKWRAEVHGHRLSLFPAFGDAVAAGPGASFTGAPDGFFAGATARAAARAFAGGSDGNLPETAEYQKAFQEIDSKVDLFNIMLLPRSAEADNRASLNLWGAASAFCKQRRAFLLVDPRSEVATIPDAILEVKQRRIGIVKDHSALYFPRVKINPDGIPREIDPSGSIAGVMARIDGTRGVWKAPAGLDSDVRGVLGVKVPMSDLENGQLNPQAANAIRVFPNGIISWGARTMDGFDNSGNDDYKYVPVRRLALFLEESLARGLKFAVFEPNDEPLWATIRLAVGAFMNNLFRQGAFQGRTARDAYFVKVDSETTTQNDINLGIVNVVVGFAPLKPAEFVVVTIQQKAGQIQV